MQDNAISKGFDALMEIAGPGWGFCGCVKNDRVLHVTDFIPNEGQVSAEQFVDWLFLADDMNPNSDREKWTPVRLALREAFIQCMGGQVVDASELRWSFSKQV
jgi:hypothetical protein